MTKNVLVLHSGGMDSTTCLLKAKAEGHEVFSLGIDYGQRLSVELQFAARQCEKYAIKRDIVTVGWAKPARSIPQDRSIATMRQSISSAFLPGRNIVLLSLAVAYAKGIGSDEVHVGLNCVDFSGYPDCTVEFLDSFRRMLEIGNPGGPAIEAPLLTFSKPQIASLAQGLGIKENDTWSCYRPQVSEGGIEPCRTCDACILHAYAWSTIT